MAMQGETGLYTQIAEITDSLFLCGASALRPERIRHLGVTTIINCTLEVHSPVYREVEVLRIQVDDVPHARLGMYFDETADKIHQVHKRGGRSLVHCVAGVSRSASICIAYLMKYHRMDLRAAYNHVLSRRPYIRPNPGFFKQLIDFERKLFGKNTVQMVTSPMGHIPDVYRDRFLHLYRPR